MGKIEIAYRESILTASPRESFIFDREAAGRKGKAGCTAAVRPLSSEYTNIDLELDDYGFSVEEDGNLIAVSFTGTEETEEGLQSLGRQLPSQLSISLIHNALKNSALAALSRGVNYGFPLINAYVSIKIDPRIHIFGNDTSATALSSAARLATNAALVKSALEGGSALMELFMNVTISVDDASFGSVMNDISSTRGGQIIALDEGDSTGESDGVPVIDLNKVYSPPDVLESPISEGVKEAAGWTGNLCYARG